MAKITGIHHAQVTVTPGQEQAARDFYLGALGLTEMTQPRALTFPGFWAHLGDQQLHVRIEDNVDRLATRAHVAYLVDDVAEFRQRLADTGIDMDDPPDWPGHPRVQFRDPFGNYVELIQTADTA